VEADPRLVGQSGDPLGPKHRWKATKHTWQAPGCHHRHPSMTTLPQGTWAPWTATIGTTTTSGSVRTRAAWSASKSTARSAGASE
jgi:hypothetical protein